MKQFPRSVGLGLVGALAALGCSSGDDSKSGSSQTNPNGDYESANPGLASQSKDDANLSGSGGGTTSGASDAAAPEGDATRDIVEADIIQLAGDRLYALSQYGGLSSIDVSTRDKPRLLGRYKNDAMPFEMYLRGNVVLGLFNSYGEYVEGADNTWSWVQASRIVALDVSDPKHIEELASFRIPGSISDSRIVGDVLYVVGYEDGYCWGCQENEPNTTILSLDVSDPMQVTRIDALRYGDEQDQYGGWYRRSVTVTENRMYVAGIEYGNGTDAIGSTIHVVDISDPGGKMLEGAALEATGQISSRWQMDEYEGVLRVISQPWSWESDQAPAVQTWKVDSAKTITPLAQLSLQIPADEQLQSARFDGPRAYAITMLQTDPLFTIDLSNPAAPVQTASLTMPGYLYYMEPRGNRLLGLGYDEGNTDGAITVSLFDVTDLNAPSMIERVNFGGDYGWLSEDQDRIHKSFNVLDDLGMIVVPFSGYSSVDKGSCGTYVSGVQLVDFDAANDDLTLRGVAKAVGQARRGFYYDKRLFTVSDDRVQVFDIADRDQPKETSNLGLLTNVAQSAILGDYVVRISNDWWTSAPRLEVTTLADAENPVPLGTLDLTSIVGSPNGDCYWSGWYARRLFAQGHLAYVVYDSYSYDDVGNGTTTTAISVVDVSSPTEPKLVATQTLPIGGYYWYYYGNLAPSGQDVVQVGTTIAQLRADVTYDANYNVENVRSYVDVVDLSDPNTPVTNTVEVPTGLGTSGLVTSGDVVALSHYEGAPGASSVRFYLDRVDVSNPAAPVLLPKISLPGSLLALDQAAAGAITVDYTTLVADDITYQDCSSEYGWDAQFVPYNSTDYAGPGRCSGLIQTLRMVRLGQGPAGIEGSYELGPTQRVSVAATGDDRTFVSIASNSGYAYGYADCFDCGYYSWATTDLPVVSMGGLHSGAFSVGETTIPGGDYWSASVLVASGKRALLSSGWRGKLSVVDATDAANPALVKSVPIQGYVQDIDVSGDKVVASLGMDGAALLDIGN